MGFLYESMKDQLRWGKLSVKHYVNIVSQIGKVMSMDDKDYNRERAKEMKIDASKLVESLKTVFGDGK